MPDQVDMHALVYALAGARGAERGITLDRLTEIGRAPNRRAMEEFIQIHLGEFPFPLISGHGGYFVPVTADELNHYINANRSRMRCLAIRNRTVTRKALAFGFHREGKRFVQTRQQQLLPIL